MEFSGTHNDQMTGFYRSKYNKDDKELWNVCTQFEPTSARMAFPCIDEPDRKATFDITMVVPDHLVALSNMPEVSRKPCGGPAVTGCDYKYVEVKFDRTPIMSTYLVAMVVGHFEYLEGRDANGVQIRVYTPLGKKEYGAFALEVAEKCLPFYRECFGVGYALPKLDLIAIPDFSMGAMENWGLVTFRESEILFNSCIASVELKQRIAIIIAHELAHMWFGNLVTMDWWTHLWLNEGFATWFENYAVDEIFPQFNCWSKFASTDQLAALSLDSLCSSHAIEIPISHPDEIEEIFDAISYFKGASIVNMLFSLMGRDKFLTAIQSYMRKYSYKNTKTNNLWKIFSQVYQADIESMMIDWTHHLGYPIVTVEKFGPNSLRFKQEHFQLNSSNQTKMLWHIPLEILPLNNEHSHRILMDNTCSELIVNCEGDCILVNPKRNTFARIKYENELFENLVKEIENKKLHETDRLAIIDDIFNFGFSGYETLTKAIKTCNFYREEESFCVWSSIKTNIYKVRNLLLENNTRKSNPNPVLSEAINGYIQFLTLPSFQKLGIQSDTLDESCNKKSLRGLIIGILGNSGSPLILDKCQEILDLHTSTGMLIDPDLFTSIISSLNYHRGEMILPVLIKLYNEADSQDVRVRVLNCLGLSKSPMIRQKSLDFILSSKVKSQDKGCGLVSIANSGPYGRALIKNLILDDFNVLSQAIQNPTLLGSLIKTTISGFAHMDTHDELVTFFNTKSFPFSMAIRQGCEQILINSKVLLRDGDKLERLFLQEMYK